MVMRRDVNKNHEVRKTRSFRNHHSESRKLLKAFVKSGIQPDEVNAWISQNHQAEASHIWANPVSQRATISRFFRGVSGIRAKYRELLWKVHKEMTWAVKEKQAKQPGDESYEGSYSSAHEEHLAKAVMARQKAERELEAELVRELDTESSAARMPCPTCGQLAPITLHPNGTWEISK